MNKYLRKMLPFTLSWSLFLGGVQPVAVYSETLTDLCTQRGLAFIFFNGVKTTRLQADQVLQEFERLHGTTSPAGDTLRYEVLYNETQGFSDFVETFEQRLREQGGVLQGRYELFFEAINGEGPWWSRIISSISEAGHILQSFNDWVRAAVVRNLTALFANPPTDVNYAEHKGRLDNIILEGKKLLFVAHSQGNLFVNPAYTYARTKVPANSVSVVHIAPASPLLSGKHILADLDLVINALRLAGTVPDITDNIPGYLLRPAGVNGSKDMLGHGILEIYMNQQLEISGRVRSYINEALTTLVAPLTVAQTGFFSATLTWDGNGDVDLHTMEPDNKHVFYGAKRGSSGFLDVDNTVALGPEHYYASCQAESLQTGTYSFQVANYSRAEGRKATVQIASWIDGVLGTRSVMLGSATGNVPSSTLFTVNVTKNTDTGQYSVAVMP